MQAKKRAQTAYHFFLSNAGYSYDPQKETRIQGRRRGAQVLALAEQWADLEGLQFVWETDPDCTEDDFEFDADKAHVREHGAVGCRLIRPCPECKDRVDAAECRHSQTLQSLWGITESLNNTERDAYRRVVEAELASEEMP